jgi:uncharacterized protein YlxW (UPF0749 family)
VLAKTYAAFKAAGVSDEQAAAAAEELADYENRLTSIDNRLSTIEARVTNLENALAQFRADVNARFTMLVWAVGINAAATIAILGVLLRGHGPPP